MQEIIQVKKGTIFIAPPGAGNRKDVLFREIVSLCPDHDFSSILYLAPNNIVLSTARGMFFNFLKKSSDNSVYIPFQTATIKQLALDLHETLGRGDAISERLRVLILCEIIREKKTGYARLLSGMLKKIRHYVPDRNLVRIKEEIGDLIFEEKAAERAAGAMDILISYEAEAKAKGVVDPEEILKGSIPVIEAHGARGKGGEKESLNLVVDGFFDPTPLEMQIIGALIEKAERVIVSAEEGTEMLEYVLSMQPELTPLKLIDIPGRKRPGYFSYPSMEDEVEGIARNIRKLIAEDINPWEITVCFPVLSRYLPMTRRIFKRYGIPMSIVESDLSGRGAFAALGEMITCIEEDYPRNDFLSLLTSPYFPAIPRIVRERALSYSYRAGIVKGMEAWLSVRDILLNSLQKDISGEEKEEFMEFGKGIVLVVDIIEDLKRRKGLLEFMDAFESALEKFGFFDSPVMSGSPVDMSGKIISRFAEFRRFSDLYESGHSHVDSPHFYLKYLLGEIIGSEEERDGVRIIPFELAPGLQTKVLFFGGMLEGDFPSRPEIDPILPENVKKALGMPYIDYYLKRQRSYFERLVNAPLREPYFSSPSADGDKILLPSPFLDWAMALSPPAPDIYTEEDVLIREGALQHALPGAKILRGTGSGEGEALHDKNSLDILRKRISATAMGFISVTAVDHYRKCPLRFYIERVLGLESEAPPRFEVESRLWGTLAHRTMEYLFKDGDVEPDLMEERLFQGLEKSLKQFPVGDFWSGVAREIFRRLLPVLREQEAEIRMHGFSPYMVEKDIRVEINGLRLRGKIDRVDLKAEGGGRLEAGGQRQRLKEGESPVVSETVFLLDYKTGSVDKESLQMPLYAGMWQEGLQGHVEKTGYYSLKEGRINWFPKKIGMEEFMHDALQKAEEVVGNMKQGIFPAMPFKDTECRYCYHQPLCRR